MSDVKIYRPDKNGDLKLIRVVTVENRLSQNSSLIGRGRVKRQRTRANKRGRL